MKKYLALLLTGVLLAGCVRYDVTLNRGTKITNVRKSYDKETDTYTFTSPSGNKQKIESSRIRIIEPHQEEQFKNKTDQFLPAR